RLALVVLCTWIGVLLWGYYSLNSVENTDKVQMWGVVQPGLSQMDRFDPAKEDDNLHHNLNLSAKCLEETEPAEVVAWPETSIPYRGFLLRKSKIRKFQTCVQDHQAWYILGSIEYSADNMPRNTISVWNEEGDCVDRYDKYKLVPFGEYLPGRDYWPKWIPGIDKVMNYSSGEAIKPVEVDGTKVGVLICFESLSTFMARQQVLNGAEVLFVPTNDAWFGESVELPYHFAMARFRAAELQRPVVQVGNTGVSGFIDKFGRVKRELPINIDGYLVESVEPCQKLTLYALWGDYFVIISFLLWGTCFILSKLRGRFFIM
ncbi:apolipoprotein N-acyltransferase, partial [bacterium]|nr:apolipoprotein N-acyltransferase [bacterium]